jgi:xanthine dehydrogenase/oxidase
MVTYVVVLVRYLLYHITSHIYIYEMVLLTLLLWASTTGYRPILDAAKSLAVDGGTTTCGLGSQCCRSGVGAAGKQGTEGEAAVIRRLGSLGGHLGSKGTHKPAPKVVDLEEGPVATTTVATSIKDESKPSITVESCTCSKASWYGSYESSSRMIDGELIFPPFLVRYTPPPLRFQSRVASWYTPVDLNQLCQLKAKYPHGKIVVGNTEAGIEVKFKDAKYPVLLNASRVPELNHVTINHNSVTFGASVTLTKVKQVMDKLRLTLSPHQQDFVTSFLTQLRYFSSTQIRNVACIGGNIVTASPIADLSPVLQATESIAHLVSAKGKRSVPMTKFFLGYRKVDLKDDEVVQSVEIPFTAMNEYTQSYKQAKRREDDISIVSSCFRIALTPTPGSDVTVAANHIVTSATLSYGGMAPTTACAARAQSYLIGKPWNEATLQGAYGALAEDFKLGPNVPGGMPEYRSSLAASFLFKFYLYVTIQIQGRSAIPASLHSAAEPYHRPISGGRQSYQVPSNMEVGTPRDHLAARAHVSGEAIYTDDMPEPPGCLHAAPVMSTKSHAMIVSIDTKAAEASPGFVSWVGVKDVTGNNVIGDIVKDEEMFANTKVVHVGHTIGLVLANTLSDAHRAARLVKVEYKELPAIISIEDAIAANSFQGVERNITNGDVEAGFRSSDIVLEGDCKMAGQEHFYLECNTSIVYPAKEIDEVVCYSSTQNPTKTQEYVARVLGIPSHRVICRVKRMGGGFGGKETRSLHLTAQAAVAAQKLRVCIISPIHSFKQLILSSFFPQ